MSICVVDAKTNEIMKIKAKNKETICPKNEASPKRLPIRKTNTRTDCSKIITCGKLYS